MIPAVFDTNVIVSGMLTASGPPGQIVEWLVQGTIRAALDDRIISEYERVLHYPQLNLPHAEVAILIERICRTGTNVVTEPKYADLRLPHKDDLPFAQCALTATAPLVTGNVRHFPSSVMGSVPVVSPGEYVQVISRS